MLHSFWRLLANLVEQLLSQIHNVLDAIKLQARDAQSSQSARHYRESLSQWYVQLLRYVVAMGEPELFLHQFWGTMISAICQPA